MLLNEVTPTDLSVDDNVLTKVLVDTPASPSIHRVAVVLENTLPAVMRPRLVWCPSHGKPSATTVDTSPCPCGHCTETTSGSVTSSGSATGTTVLVRTRMLLPNG